MTSLHLGDTDTPMTAGLDVTKNDPADIVRKAYGGIAAGAFEVLADDLSVRVKCGLAARIEALYPQLAAEPAVRQLRARFRIFPVAVMGNASANSTMRGYLHAAGLLPGPGHQFGFGRAPSRSARSQP